MKATFPRNNGPVTGMGAGSARGARTARPQARHHRAPSLARTTRGRRNGATRSARGAQTARPRVRRRAGAEDCRHADRTERRHAVQRTALRWQLWLGIVLCLCLGFTGYAQQTPPPEFFPPTGSRTPTNVVISAVEVATVIYFTTNGTAPDTSSHRYLQPLRVTETTTFRARAYLAGFTPSEERTATYYEREELADVQKLVAGDRGPAPSVQLVVTPRETVGSWAVEDTVPLPLRVQNITGGGVWDEVQRTIRWGPFIGHDPRALGYQVTHPLDGVYELNSQVSLNGSSVAVNNVSTKATVTLVHPSSPVATPVFAPAGGTSAPVTVTISCATPNAVIYYTTDGRVPTPTDARYQGPIPVTTTTNLRARALLEGYESSDTAAAAYWARENPVAAVRTVTNRTDGTAWVNLHLLDVEGHLSSAVVERLPNLVEPVEMSNDGVWQADEHAIRWGPFRGQLPTNLTYVVAGPAGTFPLDGVASVDGWSLSITGAPSVSLTTGTETVATPVFTPPGGTNVPIAVTMTCATPGATIHFTTNGAVPTSNDPAYAGPLSLVTATALRARAVRVGYQPSEVASGSYWELPVAPTLARSVMNNASPQPQLRLDVVPTSGTRTYAIEEQLPRLLEPVNISDGGVWDATTGSLRWGPFRDDQPRTLGCTLAGIAGAHSLSGVGSFDGRSFTITGAMQVVVISLLEQQVAAPVLSPAGASTLPTTVTITCATLGAEIRYTTDSTVPDGGNRSAHYTGPLTIVGTTVLRARAFVPGMTSSDTVTGWYEVPEPPGGSLIRSLTGNGTARPSVTLLANPAALTGSYAVEELLPPVVLPTEISHGGTWNPVASSIRWGPFADAVGRSLTYVANGPEGTFPLDGVASFDGRNVRATGANSFATLGSTQETPPPILTPASGTAVPLTVTISAAPGAVIRYTLNGQVPTTNDAAYAGPINLTAETVVRARAFRERELTSDTVSAWYPAVSEHGTAIRTVAGSPSTTQSVTIAVSPLATTKTYAVEEAVPLPLSPYAISHAGQWDAIARQIRWGPFADAMPRTLRYEVGGPEGDYVLAGGPSFDGVSWETGGAGSLRIRLPAPTPLSGLAGDQRVFLTWARVAGVAGYWIYYWPADHPAAQMRLDAGRPTADYFTVPSLENNTPYYFSVTAYDAVRNESGRSENIQLVPNTGLGQLGFVSFDHAFYGFTNEAVISVVDDDLNTDSSMVERVTVTITSDSDAFGFPLVLTETGPDSNRFTSSANGTNLTFTLQNSDPTNKRLKIGEGQTARVVYKDVLPALSRTNSARVESGVPVTTLVPSEALRTVDGINYASITFSYSLIATDQLSGVALIAYGIDALPGTVYDGPFRLAATGLHEIQFHAQDQANNWEPIQRFAIVVELDFDRDGLPDLWERHYGNSLTNFSAANDFDGDGLTDGLEWTSETDPTDPRTRGVFSNPEMQVDGVFQTNFQGEPSLRYRIEASTDLVQWTTIMNVTGSGVLRDENGGSGSQRFYRAVKH